MFWRCLTPRSGWVFTIPLPSWTGHGVGAPCPPPRAGHALGRSSLQLMDGGSAWLPAPVTVRSLCSCIHYLHRVVLSTASSRLCFISFLRRYKRKVSGMCLSPSGLLSQNPIDQGPYEQRGSTSHRPGGWKSSLKPPADPVSGEGVRVLSRPSPHCVLI